MRAGLFVPNFGELAHPRRMGDIAYLAEQAGWSGLFTWDHIHYRPPVEEVGDPWICLAAMATSTTDLRLGAMVTPLARRRPWTFARQAAALDLLSEGRLVLGVGLGLDSSGAELSSFDEEQDDRRRAEMLDEGLEVVRGLLSGELVDHNGPRYRATGVRFLPRPWQQPTIPIWVGARWPYRAPLRRAARFEGAFVIDIETADQLEELATVIRAERGSLEGFDLVVQGWPGDDVTQWAAAGATWWLARFDPFTVTYDAVADVIAAGPPQLPA